MRKRLEWRSLDDGAVSYTSLPIWAWMLDEWFGRVHPHWGWWQDMWAKINPDWGDPFCAAYCFPFSRWIRRWERDEPA